jgi:hypothetical protein
MGRPEGIGGESDIVARRASVETAPDSTGDARRVIPRDHPADQPSGPAPETASGQPAADAPGDASGPPAEQSDGEVGEATGSASGDASGGTSGEAIDEATGETLDDPRRAADSTTGEASS